MYMVSPIVITAAYGLKETSSHFDEATTVSEKFVAFSNNVEPQTFIY